MGVGLAVKVPATRSKCLGSVAGSGSWLQPSSHFCGPREDVVMAQITGLLLLMDMAAVEVLGRTQVRDRI